MDILARDLRFALRRLAARPGFTAVAVLSLALGIGANTAIFTLLDEILLSRPPYEDVESLVEVYPVEDGRVELNALSYPELEDLREGTGRVFSGVAARAEALPGVEAVGLVDNLALGGLSFTGRRINVDGVAPPPGQEGHVVDVVTVDGGYFEAAGVPVVAGRAFGPEDTPDGAPVVMVSQAMQERFWPGESAVGREVVDGEEIRYRVVGVVLDAKTMTEHLSFMLVPFRLGSALLSVLGLLALVLATVGLYGVVSYTAASRTREMGIRLSLGARAGQVVALVLRGGIRLVAVGLAAGLLLAFAGSRLIGGLLFGVAPTDPATFAAVTALLLLVGAAAALGPALRASRVDPVDTLKAE